MHEKRIVKDIEPENGGKRWPVLGSSFLEKTTASFYRTRAACRPRNNQISYHFRKKISATIDRRTACDGRQIIINEVEIFYELYINVNIDTIIQILHICL